VPGSVYYGYLPTTGTYWAVADFALSSTASQQTQVNFQDGGSRGVFHRLADQAWQVTVGGYPWPCPGDLPDEMRSVWNLSINGECVIVNAIPPNRGKLETVLTLPDGTYFGTLELLQYNYDETGTVLFDPSTWTNTAAPVDHQPAAWSSLSVDSRTTTTFGSVLVGTPGGVKEGIFDSGFARIVAAAMPQFAGHPTSGYVVTVQGQRIAAISKIDPLNPMATAHPDYTEPSA
jgi:hypothetical protein